MNRRGFLALAAWGAASVLLPGVAGATRSPAATARRISLYNLHTGERCEACYWENGAYVPSALEQIDTVLRDHRTGETRRIDPRLLDLVCAVTARLEHPAPVQVISGFRSASTNEMLHAEDPGRVASRSLHLTGEAVDIRLENRPLRHLRNAALALNAGGVGYYPRSGFVHLDVGTPRKW